MIDGEASWFERVDPPQPTDDQIHQAIYGLGPDATPASRVALVRRLFAKYGRQAAKPEVPVEVVLDFEFWSGDCDGRNEMKEWLAERGYAVQK